MLKKIRNIIIVFLLIVLCFVIQNAVSLSSGNLFVTPNLLIIVTCIFGYMKGSKTGIIVGFVSGLLADIFAADVIGMNAFLYMCVGFVSGVFNRLFYRDMVLLPLAIVFGGDFLYDFGYYVLRFLLRNKLDFSYYMMDIILPEMIFTTFIALVIYRVFYYIDSKWLVEEQRSTLNFD